MMSKRGMSLPVETVIILVIAAVVLGSVLMFFMGVFAPGSSSVDATRLQSSLCTQYFINNPTCDPATTSISSDAKTAATTALTELENKVCKPSIGKQLGCSGTGADCLHSCCKIQCPAPATK